MGPELYASVPNSRFRESSHRVDDHQRVQPSVDRSPASVSNVLPLRLVRIMAFLAIVSGHSAILEAQTARRISLDVSVGAGGGVGGTYDERSSVFAEAMIGVRLGPHVGHGMLVGASLGVQGPAAGEDSCNLVPNDLCASDFPSFYSVGGLVGWEGAFARDATLRLLAGPAYLWASEGHGIGATSRIDVSSPSVWHLALLLALRGTVLPDFDGATLRLWSLGAGIRVR